MLPAEVIAKRKATNKKRSERRKVQLSELKKAAENGDEEAAKKLAEIRVYNLEATMRSRQKTYDEAEAGDPEAIKRYDDYLQGRRDNYYRVKSEKVEQVSCLF